MAKIAFIEDRETLHIPYLGHSLIQGGHKPEWYSSDFFKKLRRFKPDYIGATVLRSDEEKVRERIKKARKRAPKARVIIGGPQTTLRPQETMEKVGADLALTGEAIPRLRQLLDGDESVAYTKEGYKPENPFSPLDPNMWHMYAPLTPKHNDGSYISISSIGCFGRCTYCTEVEITPKIIHRDIANVVDDMQQLQSEHGNVRKIIFMDQNFFNRPSWVNTVDDAMSSDGLDYRLIVNARADSILKAKDNIEEVQKNGRLYVVRLGVESFLDEQLTSWNKKVSAEQNMQAINTLLDYDVIPQIYVIVADKNSTLDTLEAYAQTFKDHPELFPFLFGETTMMYQNQEVDHQYPDYLESFWHLFAGVGEFNRRIDSKTYSIWEDTVEGVKKNRKLPETNTTACIKAIDEGMEIIRSIAKGETTSKAEMDNIFSKSKDILHAVYTSYR